MIEIIEAKSFLHQFDYPIIDVRSPDEFDAGHIPEAINLPLFTNDERALVGTLYKNAGKQAAIFKGLDIVGPKMSGFVKAALNIAPAQKLRVHCWRGGMRSESMAWLFSTTGFEVKILDGGYKAYRGFIRKQLGRDAKYVVLSGTTGSGKTEILHELIKSGQQVIDLEGMAHHKGSSFGALGETPQPTSEQFENELYKIWETLDHSKPIWLEDESRSIGKVSIPEPFFVKMRNCTVVRVDMSVKLRVDRLVKDYAKYPKEGLISAIERIARRLGGQHAKTAINAIENEDFETAIEIVLFYYDKTYNFGLSKRDQKNVFHVKVETINAKSNADTVMEFFKTLKFD
jgi:tRNA 2-selenouridine synthase